VLLQRFDALTDRRRGHVQAISRRLETTELDYRGEGRELTRIQAGLTGNAQ
jgi:hypothetical protein